MKGKKTKKIPVTAYICYLLAAAFAFTGVTLARYVSSSGGGAQVGVSPFACSFTVDEISSTAFSNMDYWYGDTAANSPHAVAVTARNYDGEGRVSGVDLGITLRVCAPAELLDNAAFQLAVRENGATAAVTPQYDFAKIADLTDTDGGLSLTDYGAMEYAYRDGAALNDRQGGFGGDGTGRVKAASANGITVEIAAEKKTENYSVVFIRGNEHTVETDTDDGGTLTETYVDSSGSVLYLICSKEELYYTLDVTLPGSTITGGSRGEISFVFLFTTKEKYEGGDYGAEFPADFGGGFNGGEVTGYRFDIADVPVYAAEGDAEAAGTAAVRAVYSAADGTAQYYLYEGKSLTALSDGGGAYYMCGDGYVSKDDLYYDYTKKPQGSDGSYAVGNSIGKIYAMEVKALFWQASDGSGG